MAGGPARVMAGRSYPLVTIGGGAFGDLPAQAARLSRASVAVAATRIFFIGSPYPHKRRARKNPTDGSSGPLVPESHSQRPKKIAPRKPAADSFALDHES